MMLGAMALFGASYSIGAIGAIGDSSSETSGAATDTVMQCVEPTDIMRREHMDLLLHQRDKTVRQGIRTEKHSLKECVDCHVKRDEQGAFIPINAPEQFCRACHEYASAKVDCFDCHATTPDTEVSNVRGEMKKQSNSLPVLIGAVKEKKAESQRPEIVVRSFSYAFSKTNVSSSGQM